MGLLIGVGQTRPQFPYDYFYGIEWDVTVSNPVVTRIGKNELHQSLPIQSKMRRCILKDDGTVNYYLHANDSTKRDTGSNAVLDGTDGMVMVELPEMYVRFETEGNKRRCMISDYPLPGFMLWKKDYVSAYEATVERATSKLASVMNQTPEFRGGSNNAAWDAETRSFLGKPASSISLTNFRTYARNRGSVNWNCNTYGIQRKLWWLFAVEYANFNSQEPFNAALSGEGYRQGGLGNGVTDLNATKWSTFNNQSPFVPCGYTNSLGNNTGVIAFQMPAEYDAVTFTTNVPSYRGVENPFGHIWKWTDGCKALIQSVNDGNTSEFYAAENSADYSSDGIAGYKLRGLLPRGNGYIKEMLFGELGDIMPLSIGGGTTTYFCDYFYTSVPVTGISERGVLFGGSAYHGASAGFVCSYTNNTASYASAYIGSRLCFIP